MPRLRPSSICAILSPFTLLAVLGGLSPNAGVHAAGMLVGYEEAARHGLERAWFAQIPVDPSRSRATTWFHYFDRLYCVTDAGIVTALDAETGAQLWTRQIGDSGVAAFGPDANDEYLGVVSNTRVYMLDRETGRLKWMKEIGGAPASGPALTADYAYIALLTGRVEAYKISDPAVQPWYYQSRGRTYLRPTTTGKVVSWPTTEGYVYISNAHKPAVEFRLDTKSDIVTSPAAMAPYLYVAALDGYLYCLNLDERREAWRYSTGYPIESSPAIVGKHAYVASMEPVLHCLDSKTGAKLWAAPGVSHFGAEGKQRVFASDRYGNLVILDSKTGAELGQLRTAEGVATMVNDQSDRIFLVNDRGLVQCLREIGATTPTYYRQAHEPEPEKPAATGADAAATAPAADASPFEAEDAAAAAGAGEQPVDEAAAPPEEPGGQADQAEPPAAEPDVDPFGG